MVENLVQKFKIFILSWDLVPRLTQIWRIQCWSSFFLFSTGSILFGESYSKESKLFVEAKIWNLALFEYVESIQISKIKNQKIQESKSPFGNVLFGQPWPKKLKLFVQSEIWYLQSITKIVRLAPPDSLFNVGCMFPWSFLATTAWNSIAFPFLTQHWTRAEGEFWVSLSKCNSFLGLFHENVMSLKNFCDSLSQNWWIWV